MSGSILPGVTRASILQLAAEEGYEVKEEPIAIEDALLADEVFTTGTAVVVASVGSITHLGEKRVFNHGKVGKVTETMYSKLTGIQKRDVEDKHGWVRAVWEASS